MPRSATWKYIQNQFEIVTRKSRVKMNAIVVDFFAKLTAAAAVAGSDPRLATMLTAFTPLKDAWISAYSGWRNMKDYYGGGTDVFEALLTLLHTPPGSDQTSKIENWDTRIRVETPFKGSLYNTLLPNGRAPFSQGARDEIVQEVKDLGERLSAQTTKPALVALGLEVTTYYHQLDSARTGQQGQEGSVVIDAATIEAQRVTMADALYGNLGMLMNIYSAAIERGKIAGFFDLELLRDPEETGDDAGGTTPPTPPPGS